MRSTPNRCEQSDRLPAGRYRRRYVAQVNTTEANIGVTAVFRYSAWFSFCLGDEIQFDESANGLVLTKIVAYGGLHPDRVRFENASTKESFSMH